MARGPFLVGLLLSAVVHFCLLIPGARRPQHVEGVVGVIETDFATLEAPEVEVVASTALENPARTSEDAPPAPSTPVPSPPATPPPPAIPPPTRVSEPTPPQDDQPSNPPATPALVRSAEPAPISLPEQGDLAGEREGRSAPELRIDWGTAQAANRTLEAGQMKVVVLQDGPEGAMPIISEAVEQFEGVWQRRPFASAALLFSNNLRIVDGVPAFEQIGHEVGLRWPERLAVLVPRSVERLLQSAQLEAAFRKGLTMERIRSFGGRFTISDGALGFEITRVVEGESS